MTTKTSLKSLALILCGALLLIGCGDEKNSSPTGPGNNGGVVDDNNGDVVDDNNGGDNNGDLVTDGDALTFHKDVRPMVEEKCLDCHVPGGVAPAAYDMSSMEKIVALAPLIRNSVEMGRMPPWQAQDGCNDYLADISLDADQIGMFGKWVDDGMIEGDEADYVAPTRVDELGLDRLPPTPTLAASPKAPFEPDFSVSDDFRCFVVDPELEEPRHMMAFNVDVDNASLLHHVVMFTVPGDDETLAELEALEAEDEQEGYKCYGGPRTSQVGVGMAWAPGSHGIIFPEGVGMTVDPGTRFIVQMHYNTAEGTGVDQSAVNLWFMDKGETPSTYARLQFAGNLPFEVPPGANGLEAEECGKIYVDMADFTSLSSDVAPPAEGVDAFSIWNDRAEHQKVGATGCVQMEFYYNFPIALDILGVGPHMHTVGQNIKVEIKPVDDSSGVAEIMEDEEGGLCLVDIDRWDFNWQRGYGFRDVPKIPSKGVIRLTCRYDNSLGEDPVRLGEGTGDEMCLALLSFLSPI